MPNLTLLGPYPPPFGGVALHLIRLHEALRSKGFAVAGASTGDVPKSLDGVRKIGLRDLLSRQPVHLHTDEGNARLTVLLGWAWRITRRRYALTVHSFRIRPDLQHLNKHLARVYANACLVIAISNEVRQALTEQLPLDPITIQVIPSALPISAWEKSLPTPHGLPSEWVHAKYRVLANAGRVVRYQGNDLYGIDTLLEAFKAYNRNDASLLVVLGQIADRDLYNTIVAQAALDSRIHLLTQFDSPLTTITHHAHVVVRPTRTEGGESLTLTEAQELGVHTIGSDAVPRPPGTMIFETGNVESLTQALNLISQQSELPHPLTANTTAIESLIEAYSSSGLL